MNFEEKTISSEKVYDGKLLKIYKDQVELPNGEKAIREYNVHNGGACILAEKDDKILLVRQYRYPLHESVLEVPAGKVNIGENPYDTAVRELEEECGYKADKIELLFEMFPTPAYTSEITYIFKATGLTKGKVNLDEDEFLTSEWIDKSKLKEMLDNREIKDGKTIIALLYALNR